VGGLRVPNAGPFDDLSAPESRLVFKSRDLSLQAFHSIVGRRKRRTQIGNLAAKVCEPGPIISQFGIFQNLRHLGLVKQPGPVPFRML
jgi:hypothetical protein